MSIDVRLASGCLTATPTRKPARCCGATGQRHVQNARSNLNARKGPEPRITRWEHEHLLEAVPQRLDANPRAMRQRCETVEHPFGTIKVRMGATHFLTKTLPKVAAEMALSVLAYNLARAMNIVGVKPLLAVFCRKDQHFIRIGIRSTATTQPKRPRVCLWKQHLVCA